MIDGVFANTSFFDGFLRFLRFLSFLHFLAAFRSGLATFFLAFLFVWIVDCRVYRIFVNAGVQFFEKRIGRFNEMFVARIPNGLQLRWSNNRMWWDSIEWVLAFGFFAFFSALSAFFTALSFITALATFTALTSFAALSLFFMNTSLVFASLSAFG